MTLKDYLMQTSEGEEITVWDDTYDIEVYFYNQTGDAWDDAMMDFASKLDIVDVKNSGVVVDMYGLIERNIDALEASDLFIHPDVDSIMDDMENILAGYVSEDWLVKFVSCLNSDVSASKKMPAKKYIKNGTEFNSHRLPISMLEGLDDRFDFDLDDVFNFYLDTYAGDAVGYVTDSKVIGDGAGVEYTVVVAIPERANHWQMKDDIERNLERYITEQVDGTDYTGGIISVESGADSYDLPDDVVDNCALFTAEVEIVPYQNISDWGDYGIDFGTEEYTDHITKGTPWPPEYE